MEKKPKKKMEAECSVCKAKFNVFVSRTDHSGKIDEKMKGNFDQYCPICRNLKDRNKLEE